MDVQFQKNTIKKGDPGFQYDKRVSFNYNAEEAEDNSWDESEDEMKSRREIFGGAAIHFQILHNRGWPHIPDLIAPNAAAQEYHQENHIKIKRKLKENLIMNELLF